VGKSDIEIARAAKLQPISTIADGLGLAPADIEPYGAYKAKVRLEALAALDGRPDGTLVLVTAMTPTPAGEGKSTTTVGLADAFRRLGHRAIVAIREPSLGPCFGVKGGAAGGGHAQVVPMEDINLHFTGDIHAVGAAHNLLAAVLDNALFQGNPLGLDARRIAWKRVLDMNDRALRQAVIGLGGPAHGVPRESGFEITSASEVMAILALARDLADLKGRLARVIVGETPDGRFVTAGDLRVSGALAVLLKDALKPNLVQTLEATPAFVHGGPSATSRTAATASLPRASPSNSVTWWSPRRVSRATSVPRSSSTSSVARAISCRRRRWWWPPCAR
jgi:formate--tetrahydrofolate ligase